MVDVDSVDYVSLPQPDVVAIGFVLQPPTELVVVAAELVIELLLLLGTGLVAIAAEIPETNALEAVAMAGLELKAAERVRVFRRVVLEQLRLGARIMYKISWSRPKICYAIHAYLSKWNGVTTFRHDGSVSTWAEQVRSNILQILQL